MSKTKLLSFHSLDEIKDALDKLKSKKTIPLILSRGCERIKYNEHSIRKWKDLNGVVRYDIAYYE